MRVRCIKCNAVTILPSGRGKCKGCDRQLNVERKKVNSIPGQRRGTVHTLPDNRGFVHTSFQNQGSLDIGAMKGLGGLFGNIFEMVGKLQELNKKTEGLNDNIKIDQGGKVSVLGKEFDFSPVVSAVKKGQRREEKRVKIEPKLEVEIFDEKDKVVLTVDLKGFDRNKVNIRIESDKYIITAEDRQGKTHRREIKNPSDVIASKSEEHFKNGILSIVLPKGKKKCKKKGK